MYDPTEPTFSSTPQGTVTYSTITIDQPSGTVQQCASNNRNCSNPGTLTAAGATPAAVSLTACIAWDGVTLPSEATVKDALTVAGAAKSDFSATANADLSITITWAGGARTMGTMLAGLCTPTPDPGDPGDPGDPPTPDEPPAGEVP